MQMFENNLPVWGPLRGSASLVGFRLPASGKRRVSEASSPVMRWAVDYRRDAEPQRKTQRRSLSREQC